MKEMRDQDKLSVKNAHFLKNNYDLIDNFSIENLRENIHLKDLKDNLNFAELFFPKGFLDKNQEDSENKDLDSLINKDKNKLHRLDNLQKIKSSSIDFLSQLHDKNIPYCKMAIPQAKCNNIEILHKTGCIVKSIKNTNSIDLLIAASDRLLNQGVLEEVERTINSRTFSNETSDNSNISSDSILLNKKKERKANYCHNRGCENKDRQSKNLFRINKEGTNTSVELLCKKCYNAWKNKQFCYYCYLIYTKETNDNNNWVQCDYCSSWHHISCEEKRGIFKQIMKHNIEGDFKYKCPNCRKKDKIKTKDNGLNEAIPNEYCRNYNSEKLSKKRNFSTEKKNNFKRSKRRLTPNDCREIYNDLLRIIY